MAPKKGRTIKAARTSRSTNSRAGTYLRYSIFTHLFYLCRTINRYINLPHVLLFCDREARSDKKFIQEQKKRILKKKKKKPEYALFRGLYNRRRTDGCVTVGRSLHFYFHSGELFPPVRNQRTSQPCVCTTMSSNQHGHITIGMLEELYASFSSREAFSTVCRISQQLCCHGVDTRSANHNQVLRRYTGHFAVQLAGNAHFDFRQIATGRFL